MDEADHNWAHRGYAVVRKILTEPLCDFLYEYALKSAKCGRLRVGDSGVPETPCSYADTLMESLLEILLPRVETITAIRLYPTFSYLRVYKRGDTLKRHTDRPACEISATLSLGCSANERWPIWTEGRDGDHSFELGRGDALVYKGTEMPHWRETLMGEHAAQVTLHYVDQNGPSRDWLYDRRTGLNISPGIKTLLTALGSVNEAADLVTRES